MSSKRLSIVFALALLLPLLSAQNSAPAPITVGYPQLSGGSMPLWVIAENHLDQRYGVDVKPIYIAGGAILTHSLIAGDVSIALTGGAVVGAILGGADLGQGQVKGEAIQCPFHHWEYGADGACTHIPATTEIPPWARQTCYPVQERHGYIFFFNRPEPLFPLPFYAGLNPDDFVASRPFTATLRCPWYMVGANCFDVQHMKPAAERARDVVPVGQRARRRVAEIERDKDGVELDHTDLTL